MTRIPIRIILEKDRAEHFLSKKIKLIVEIVFFSYVCAWTDKQTDPNALHSHSPVARVINGDTRGTHTPHCHWRARKLMREGFSSSKLASETLPHSDRHRNIAQVRETPHKTPPLYNSRTHEAIVVINRQIGDAKLVDAIRNVRRSH